MTSVLPYYSNIDQHTNPAFIEYFECIREYGEAANPHDLFNLSGEIDEISAKIEVMAKCLVNLRHRDSTAHDEINANERAMSRLQGDLMNRKTKREQVVTLLRLQEQLYPHSR